MKRDASRIDIGLLEQYADGALDGATRGDVTEALRRSPALRERLTRVHEVDRIARAGFELRTNGAAVKRSSTSLVRWGAALAGVAAAMWLVAIWAMPDAQQAIKEPAVAAHGGAAASPTAAAEPVRVVLTMPVRRPKPTGGSADANKPEPLRVHAIPVADVFEERFERLLDQNQPEAATALLATLSTESRARGLAMLAERIRSAATVERVLAALPPEQQVELCGELVRAGGLQATAFARLRELALDPLTATPVGALIRRLAAEPALRPPLRGYGLLPPEGV